MTRPTLQQIQQVMQKQQAKQAAESKRLKAQQERDNRARAIERTAVIGETMRLKREARLKAALGR